MFIVRGKYDAPVVMAELKGLAAAAGVMGMGGNGAGGAATQGAAAQGASTMAAKGEGMPRMDIDENSTLLFPSNEMLVMVESDKVADRDNAIALFTGAMKAGHGTFGENAQMAALVKGVDAKSPVWGVAKMNDMMRQEPMLAGIDTLTMESAVKEGAIDFTFKGRGADAEKVKASAAELDKDIQGVLPMAQQEVARNPMEQPVLDMVLSLKVEAKGNEASFTGELKKSILQYMFQEMGPEILSELDVSANDANPAAGNMPSDIAPARP